MYFDPRQTSKRGVVKGDQCEYTLFLYNDDNHTFEYVVKVLMDICAHESNQAEQCAYLAHYKGKCDVKTGGAEMMRLLCSGLRKKGLKATVKKKLITDKNSDI